MKFSESWLREWVNPAISTEELSNKLPWPVWKLTP